VNLIYLINQPIKEGNEDQRGETQKKLAVMLKKVLIASSYIYWLYQNIFMTRHLKLFGLYLHESDLLKNYSTAH